MIDPRVQLLNELSDWAIVNSKESRNEAVYVGFLDVALQLHALAVLVASAESPGDVVEVQKAGGLLSSKFTPKDLVIIGRMNTMRRDPGFRRALDDALVQFIEAKRRPS